MEEESDDQVHRAWTVRGRVQGVGFRWWTRRTAQELGLAGWVRNREDGAVEVEAAGARSAVEALAEALARGPVGSRVDAVEERNGTGVALRGGFEIRS